MLIAPTVRDHAELLRREFESATPFRHLAIDQFLPADFCGELMAEFPSFDRERARNELGAVGGKSRF
jgi:hypothetical protein